MGRADFQIVIGNGYALDADDIIGAGGNGDPVIPPIVGMVLNGTAGNDVLTGNIADDTLYGYDGNDILNGSDGNDQHRRRQRRRHRDRRGGQRHLLLPRPLHASAGDMITDFGDGDLIDISDIDAKTSIGRHPAVHLHRLERLQRPHGRARYADGVLSGDINGDGQADFQIVDRQRLRPRRRRHHRRRRQRRSGDPADRRHGAERHRRQRRPHRQHRGRHPQWLRRRRQSERQRRQRPASSAAPAPTPWSAAKATTRFVYRPRLPRSAGDLITDFSDGDLIDLSAIDAKVKRGGIQQFTFIGSNAFNGRSGELRYADGVLSGDVNGDGQADFQIAIGNSYALDADDIIGAGGNGDPVIPPIVGMVLNGDRRQRRPHRQHRGRHAQWLRGPRHPERQRRQRPPRRRHRRRQPGRRRGQRHLRLPLRLARQRRRCDHRLRRRRRDRHLRHRRQGERRGQPAVHLYRLERLQRPPGELRYADGILSGDVNGDGQSRLPDRDQQRLRSRRRRHHRRGRQRRPGIPPVVGVVLNGTAGNDVLTGNIARRHPQRQSPAPIV